LKPFFVIRIIETVFRASDFEFVSDFEIWVSDLLPAATSGWQSRPVGQFPALSHAGRRSVGGGRRNRLIAKDLWRADYGATPSAAMVQWS
jgi:hypothetical protein